MTPGPETLPVESTAYERTVRRFRETRTVLPTFAQLADPPTIPAAARAALAGVDPDAPDPRNLFRVHWNNAADRRGVQPGCPFPGQRPRVERRGVGSQDASSSSGSASRQAYSDCFTSPTQNTDRPALGSASISSSIGRSRSNCVMDVSWNSSSRRWVMRPSSR